MTMIREAAMLALRDDMNAKEVGMKYFEAAMKKVSSSVSLSDVNKYKQIEEKYLRNVKAGVEKNGEGYLG